MHQFDEERKFFPGTGDFDENGYGDGKFHALNVPLKVGLNDDTFRFIFDKIFDEVMSVY